jgi:transposase
MSRNQSQSISREEMRRKEKLAIQLLKKGKRVSEVAQDKRIGVHRTTVQRWAKKNGIELEFPYDRHAKRDDLVDVKEIIRLRKKKNSKGRYVFTRAEIAGLCKCSEGYVKKVLTQAKKDGKL